MPLKSLWRMWLCCSLNVQEGSDLTKNSFRVEMRGLEEDDVVHSVGHSGLKDAREEGSHK